MLTVDEALSHLEAQSSLDGIAAFLLTEGIRGHSGNKWKCPVAIYLKRETGFERIAVHDGVCSTYYYNYDLPEDVAQFVKDVDAGLYPDLEDLDIHV